MFSGIIETTGIVSEVIREGSNTHFIITSPISHEAYIDQSIAHDGVCLTVVKIDQNTHMVTAIKETLSKTNLGQWKPNRIVNLERSLLSGSRIDGHFVQGHVDTTAICTGVESMDGSWVYRFGMDPKWQNYIVEKGSISINGVSLTVVDTDDPGFSVAIIPYTYEHTNFRLIQTNDVVNLEFDILGKYLINYLNKIKIK